MNYDKPGFYSTFCVEFRLEGLAVDSLLKVVFISIESTFISNQQLG